MEALLPDWLSGLHGRASVRSVANPFALLCTDCGPSSRLPSRSVKGRTDNLAGDIRHQHTTIAAGTDIVSIGERGRSVYVMCDGWAVRYHRVRAGTRQILDVLIPGDAAALASVLIGSSRCSVQALTAATVCVLNGRQVTRALKTDSDFAFSVLCARVEEERRIDARLTMIGRMSAEEKVSYFMVETYDRLRQRGMADATGCPFPLRRADLADAIGLSTVHVLRALRALRSQGMVEISGRHLLIPDVARLAEHAGYLLA
jgi:CRP-like cAMP-binding protein